MGMNDSFYFTHDYSARNDSKILELRSEYGWEGYGLFFALIETMCENGGQIKSQALGGLSLGLNIDKAKLKQVISYCLELGLFYEPEEGILKNHRIDAHFEKRRKLSLAGAKGGRPKKEKKPGFSLPKGRRGEERKGEERKEENTNKKGIICVGGIWIENLDEFFQERLSISYHKWSQGKDLYNATLKYFIEKNIGASYNSPEELRKHFGNTWMQQKQNQSKKAPPKNFDERLSDAQETSARVQAILKQESNYE